MHTPGNKSRERVISEYERVAKGHASPPGIVSNNTEKLVHGPEDEDQIS